MPNKITLLNSERMNGSYLVFTENVDLAESTGALEIQETEIAEVDIQEGEGGAAKKALKVRIKAIHAGRTGNHHIFLANKLQGSEEAHSGVHSFTYPYNKPMLTHHKSLGEPVGRIMLAEYSEEEGGVIVIEVIVSDPDAMEKVKDGRYNTVSIGCRTNAAKCNICGTDRMEEWCSHRRGVEYEGVVCGWELGDLFFYECSFVNVPADEKAQTLSWEEVDYDKYTEAQTDTNGSVEESAEGSLVVTASAEANGEENNASTQEASSEDPAQAEADQVVENTTVEDEEDAAASTEVGIVVEEGLDCDNPNALENAIVASVTESINGTIQTVVESVVASTITSALEPILSYNQECDNLKRIIAQNNGSIEKASLISEQALSALKDIYSRLQGYLEGEETDNFDFAWSVEQLKEKIDNLFTRIEDVSTMQEQYKVEHQNNSKNVIEEKPSSYKSVNEKNADAMHAFLTTKRY